MSEPAWMIYGANGYTGALAAEIAVKRGKRPVLAGRTADRIRPLAERLKLDYRTFGLDRPEDIRKGLDGMAAVLHCAGPFSATSRPMVDGCLAAGVHYLDITGEIEVFEAIAARHEEARAAKVALMPGVGFDVVPSDCLAASLHRALPDATELELAFGGFNRISPGTLKTVVEGIPHGSKIRKDGKIVSIPAGSRTRPLRLGGKSYTGVSIPWGDVSTAYQSTGIPNITVYVPVPAPVIAGMRIGRPFLPLFGRPAVQRFLKNQVERHVTGPDESYRQSARVYLWGCVRNASGKTVEGTLEISEVYLFTVDAALAATERVAAGEVPGGAWTPSKAFGAGFVTRLPGAKLQIG